MIGGVVFRVDGLAFFLPATVAMKVMGVPDVARVPGGPADLVGVAIVDGETLPVVAASDARGAMLVVTHAGERVGLTGVEIVATGRFEQAGEDAITLEGARVPAFDLAALVARVRETRWAV